MQDPDRELFKAIETRDVDLARRAIEAGADVNRPHASNNYTTPLLPVQWAGLSCHGEMLKAFLDAGADINAVSEPNGPNALSLSLLRIGAKNDDAKIESFVSMALEAGATTDCKYPNGRQAIHQAVFGGFKDVVKNLIEHGADPNAIDPAGTSCLHLAAISDRSSAPNIIALLIQAGANSDVQDTSGKTPLQYIANAKTRLSNIKMLVALGASTEDVDSSDHTVGQVLATSPMTLAMGYGSRQLLTLSLENNYSKPDYDEKLNATIQAAEQNGLNEEVDFLITFKRSYKAREYARNALAELGLDLKFDL